MSEHWYMGHQWVANMGYKMSDVLFFLLPKDSLHGLATDVYGVPLYYDPQGSVWPKDGGLGELVEMPQ